MTCGRALADVLYIYPLKKDKKINPGRFKAFREAMVNAAEVANESGDHQMGAVLYEQAVLAEGGQLDDPSGFVQRLNRVMLQA